jgi:hypothetical protein
VRRFITKKKKATTPLRSEMLMGRADRGEMGDRAAQRATRKPPHAR